MPSLEDNRKESPCGQIHGNYQSLCSYRLADDRLLIDAPLCAGLQGFILVNAAEIMRYTYMETHYPNGWSEQDTECVEAMFRKVFQPVLSKFFQTAPLY